MKDGSLNRKFNILNKLKINNCTKMKITKLFAVLLLLIGGATTVSAQEVDEQCLSNSSISHEAVQAGNYKDAYGPWKQVIANCPLLRFYTYSDGFKILTAFLAETQKGSEEYNKYFEELMDLHDKRIENTPKFLAKGVKVSSVADALGKKAIDYISYAPKIDLDQAYGWLKTSIDGEKSRSLPAVLHYAVDLSLQKYQADENFKESFINDYLMVSELSEEAASAAKKKNLKAAYETTKENLSAMFVNSGAADCESLQNIYADKVETNKDDAEYLKQVLTVMRNLKCTDAEVYEQASFYAYQIEPTVEAAIGVGYRAYKKGDINEAIKFFNEALNLETDNSKKAEKAYISASILLGSKRYSEARNYALKALSFDASYGNAYLIIARAYASNPNWSDEDVLNKCTYFLVIDKLVKARSVDPSVAAEANQLINTYSKYTPSAQDLFMLGYKNGDKITIGGWIGEATTIR